MTLVLPLTMMVLPPNSSLSRAFGARAFIVSERLGWREFDEHWAPVIIHLCIKRMPIDSATGSWRATN